MILFMFFSVLLIKRSQSQEYHLLAYFNVCCRTFILVGPELGATGEDNSDAAQSMWVIDRSTGKRVSFRLLRWLRTPDSVDFAHGQVEHQTDDNE